MAVRAKFRCNQIRLTRASAETSEAKEITKGHGYGEHERLCKDAGIDRFIIFDQPTIELQAVTGEDNQTWASATPSGTLTMTISNPTAAEQFELGKSYYIDFTEAE